MGEQTLLAAVTARGIATLTLNRPDKGNCYDAPMLAALHAHFAACGKDAAVRAIVLRGAGKHFCVGAEISRPGQPRNDEGGASSGPSLIDVLLELDRVPKPTIALVQGACVGGGLAFACCCDIVIASSHAFFSIPEVRIGIPPSALIPFFVRAMGDRGLRRYGLSGERFSAAEALRMGIAQQVCEPDGIEAALAEVIEGILLSAPGAVRESKQAAARFAAQPIPVERLQQMERSFKDVLDSDEAREGRASFVEKRKPRWYPPS